MRDILYLSVTVTETVMTVKFTFVGLFKILHYPFHPRVLFCSLRLCSDWKHSRPFFHEHRSNTDTHTQTRTLTLTHTHGLKCWNRKKNILQKNFFKKKKQKKMRFTLCCVALGAREDWWESSPMEEQSNEDSILARVASCQAEAKDKKKKGEKKQSFLEYFMPMNGAIWQRVSHRTFTAHLFCCCFFFWLSVRRRTKKKEKKKTKTTFIDTHRTLNRW